MVSFFSPCSAVDAYLSLNPDQQENLKLSSRLLSMARTQPQSQTYLSDYERGQTSLSRTPEALQGIKLSNTRPAYQQRKGADLGNQDQFNDGDVDDYTQSLAAQQAYSPIDHLPERIGNHRNPKTISSQTMQGMSTASHLSRQISKQRYAAIAPRHTPKPPSWNDSGEIDRTNINEQGNRLERGGGKLDRTANQTRKTLSSETMQAADGIESRNPPASKRRRINKVDG